MLKNLLLTLRRLCWLLALLAASSAHAGSVDALRTLLADGERIVAAYQPARALESSQAMSSLYFNVFEGGGIELTLAQRDNARMKRLEFHFATVIQAMVRGEEAAQVGRDWQQLRDALLETRPLLDEAERTPLATFWQTLLILLREGLEAMLIIGALAAFLRKSGRGDDVRVLYAGAALGVMLSLACGALLIRLVQNSGSYKPLLEGSSMLLAAAMLLWVGNWLLAQRHAINWQHYVRQQLGHAGHSTLAMAGVALLAVFREGAESVLFITAIAAAPQASGSGLWGGLAAASAILLAAFLLLRRLALAIPLKPFFLVSALLLLMMGLVFTGQGVAELQLTGLLGSHPAPAFPSLPWLGLFPTVEGLAAQGGFVALLLGWIWLARRARGQTSPAVAAQ